jgi:hypothetical protein
MTNISEQDCDTYALATGTQHFGTHVFRVGMIRVTLLLLCCGVDRVGHYITHFRQLCGAEWPPDGARKYTNVLTADGLHPFK